MRRYSASWGTLGRGLAERLAWRLNKYVLLYETAAEARAKVPEHFPAHRALWEKYRAAGTLLMIGPFTNPGEGAMGIFTTREAAEEFVANDPFVIHGLVATWRLLEWNEALV